MLETQLKELINKMETLTEVMAKVSSGFSGKSDTKKSTKIKPVTPKPADIAVVEVVTEEQATIVSDDKSRAEVRDYLMNSLQKNPDKNRPKIFKILAKYDATTIPEADDLGKLQDLYRDLKKEFENV